MTRLFGIAGIALAVVGIWSYGCERQRAGGLAEKLATLEHQYDSLQKVERGLDTVYLVRKDTLRLTRHRTDSILATDTLWRTDTVRVMIAAERRACDQLVSTCEDQKTLLRRENANLQKRLTLQKPPGWLKRTMGKVVWAGAGYAAGRLTR